MNTPCALCRPAVLLTGLLMLASCSSPKSPEEAVRILHESGAALMGTVSRQAQDTVTLTKMAAEKLQQQADTLKKRADDVQAGIDSIKKGTDLLQRGISGSGGGK